MKIAYSALATQWTLPYAATHIGEIKTDAKVVIGIDFGTTYSGISFVYKDNPTKVNCGAPGVKHSRDEVKVPTVLLKEPDGSWSFGYTALNKYKKLVEESRDEVLDADPNATIPTINDILKKKKISLFRSFKMELKGKTSGMNTLTAESTIGESHNLMDLIARSLRFLSEFALQEIHSGFAGALNISNDEILWVVTVPAIWNDFGKAFMRKAAVQAGIIDKETSDKLIFALEPESASLAVFGEASTMGLFKEGTSYMMLDCGGGTVDITLHTVDKTQPLALKEICTPSGGKWGGIYVDAQFRLFLEKLFGENRFRYLEEKYSTEVAEVMDEFREKKEDFDPNEEDELTQIDLSHLFDDLINTSESAALIDLVKSYNSTRTYLQFNLSSNRTQRDIKRFHRLALTRDQMLSFFKPTLDSICDAVSGLLSAYPKVDIIAVVGGYGSCKVLHDRIKFEFDTNSRRVLIPDGIIRPQAAIVHGAAYFGLYSNIVKIRPSRFTYGIGTSRRWHEGCGFPKSEATYNEKLQEMWVEDVFSTIVKKEQPISSLETFEDGSTYSPLYQDQKVVSFKLLMSNEENPERVTASNCEVLGKIVVPCRNKDDSFRVEFSFTTELHAEVIRKDGEQYRTTVRME